MIQVWLFGVVDDQVTILSDMSMKEVCTYKTMLMKDYCVF